MKGIAKENLLDVKIVKVVKKVENEKKISREKDKNDIHIIESLI